jgi:hypothetical protein
MSDDYTTFTYTTVTQPGLTLVYDGTPSHGALVAWNSEAGPGTDPWGNSYPAGIGCENGYDLAPIVWPGVALVRVSGAGPSSTCG